jgi:hypothetical protein
MWCLTDNVTSNRCWSTQIKRICAGYFSVGVIGPEPGPMPSRP